MAYLLDTHTLLWWFDDPDILTSKARKTIEDPKNVIFVSSVLTWEIMIKKSLGKLKVPDSIFTIIRKGKFQELPISIEHTRALGSLPFHHQDPFDRLLIAQAKVEGSTIITRDSRLAKYDVRIVKA